MEIKKEFNQMHSKFYFVDYLREFFYNKYSKDDIKKYDYYFLATVDGENYQFLIDEMVEKMVANEDFDLIPPDYFDYDLKTITIRQIKSLLRYYAHLIMIVHLKF